jgi:hypothetical protein
MRRIAVVVCVLAVVGCDGGSSTFNPSGPGATPIEQLSPQQATTLCTEELTFEANFLSPSTKVEYTCRVAGFQAVALAGNSIATDADVQAFCKVGYDACKANPPASDPAPTDITTVCATASTITVGCSATVDQYAACINERVGMLPKVAPPCNQLTKAKLLEIALTQDGPACTHVMDLCPQLASSEMMTSALKIMKR